VRKDRALGDYKHNDTSALRLAVLGVRLRRHPMRRHPMRTAQRQRS
jgi:hypothetical protein